MVFHYNEGCYLVFIRILVNIEMMKDEIEMLQINGFKELNS